MKGKLGLYYKDAQAKFVKGKRITLEKQVVNPLNTYTFRLPPQLKAGATFNRNDVPIVFKVSPDTLVNLCCHVLDKIKLPPVYEWTYKEVGNWIEKYGYPQYKQAFSTNFVTGRTLLLVDASALSAMNIKDFDHIRHITNGIRSLFFYELTRFGRSISLAPEYHNEIYKMFRVNSGQTYDLVKRSDLWRRLNLIRQNKRDYTHWEKLERWLAFEKDDLYPELIGMGPKRNLYRCKTEGMVPPPPPPPPPGPKCTCIPPCSCHWNERDLRAPWRLHILKPDQAPEPILVKPHCQKCIAPCTCNWDSRMYKPRTVFNVLQEAFPMKYGLLRKYIMYMDPKYTAKMYTKYRGSIPAYRRQRYSLLLNA